MDSLNRHEDYGKEALDQTDLLADPIEQFKAWLNDAEAQEIYEPNAFVLGTVTPENTPSSRTVLLKGVDEHGFIFFTNFDSRKGTSIAQNPSVSAVFGWYSMYRQVLIEGVAKTVHGEDSDEYFHSRPQESQVAAWSSNQSQPIKNRDALDAQFQSALDKFKSDEVPRPDYWGGYRIVPTRIEFWKGRSNRMHDRIAFTRTLDTADEPSQWKIQRLQP
jgi:pyridoxamine 5'-phosphate oxidase